MLEKGFILGASEDGIVYYRKNKNEYGLEIEQKNREWLEIVQKALEKAYNKKSNIRKMKKGYYRLNVYSKNIYNELMKFRKTPELILLEPKEFQTEFLCGVFDAEGSVRKDRNHISISLNKENTIQVIQELISRTGIKTGKQWKDKSSVITIPIYGSENMQRFSNTINFRHPDKARRLEDLIKMTDKSPIMVS